jgi:uncharacterized protein YjbI with pentapeptide repeats
MRESDFSGSTFNGAYLEKAVAYKANFTGNLVAISTIYIMNDRQNIFMKQQSHATRN